MRSTRVAPVDASMLARLVKERAVAPEAVEPAQPTSSKALLRVGDCSPLPPPPLSPEEYQPYNTHYCAQQRTAATEREQRMPHAAVTGQRAVRSAHPRPNQLINHNSSTPPPTRPSITPPNGPAHGSTSASTANHRSRHLSRRFLYSILCHGSFHPSSEHIIHLASPCLTALPAPLAQLASSCVVQTPSSCDASEPPNPRHQRFRTLFLWLRRGMVQRYRPDSQSFLLPSRDTNTRRPSQACVSVRQRAVRGTPSPPPPTPHQQSLPNSMLPGKSLDSRS